MAAMKKGAPAKKSGKGMVPGKKLAAALKDAVAGRRMAEEAMDTKKLVGAKHGGMAKKAHKAKGKK